MAWKSKEAVFLVADSAVSSSTPAKNRSSSFGEAQLADGAVHVEQGALKILPIGSTGFTFAGERRFGYAIADAYATGLAHGVATEAAFRSAVASVLPFPKGVGLGVIVASVEQARPSILSFDSDSGSIQTQEEIVRFGSLEEQKGARIAKVAMTLTRDNKLTSAALLAIVVSYLQSHSISSPAIEDGVGGHFIGALFDGQGAHWQPDMLYVLYDSSHMIKDNYSITSIVRDNVACINSGLTNDTRCFCNAMSEAQVSAWKGKWLVEAVNFSLRGRCDYMSFLDSRRWRVVMVEMLGELEHRLLRNDPSPDGSSWAGTELSSELVGELSRDFPDEMALTFRPFEPPPVAKK